MQKYLICFKLITLTGLLLRLTHVALALPDKFFKLQFLQGFLVGVSLGHLAWMATKVSVYSSGLGK